LSLAAEKLTPRGLPLAAEELVDDLDECLVWDWRDAEAQLAVEYWEAFQEFTHAGG
jgi:hypothetical protein